jgi:prepilin-type N-terminal cleavage/methylation domain-containing protein
VSTLANRCKLKRGPREPDREGPHARPCWRNRITSSRKLAVRGRRGVSLIEVLVCVAILGILVSLMGPAVQSSRERARLTQCHANLKGLGLAAHAFESTQGAFPYTATSSGIKTPAGYVQLNSRSPHADLMQSMAPAVFEELLSEDATQPLCEVVPFSIIPAHQAVLRMRFPFFLCPSDPVPTGANSYRANMGATQGINLTQSPPEYAGAFTNGSRVRAAEFTDGLSHTALFSEKCMGDGDPSRYTPSGDRFFLPMVVPDRDGYEQVCGDTLLSSVVRADSYAGHTWLWGGYSQTWYNHLLPPNSPIPDCADGPGFTIGGGPGLYSARSHHAGVAGVCFGDGAVRPISREIDIQVWRAMGTRKERD